LANIDAQTVVILEDTHLEVFHNLTQNPSYTFKADAGDEAGRFILSFESLQRIESISSQNASTVTANLEGTDQAASIDIIGNQHDVKINFYNHASNQAEVYIYNMAGHEIYSNHHADISSGMIDIKLHHANTGMYVVKVITGQVTHSEKIHL
jgi:hypothetical protein